MSLYNYVANKDDLLDGMVDLVFSEIDCRPPTVDWKAAMRQRAISARQVLRRHPWAIGLMESRTNPGPPRCGTTTRSSAASRGGLLGRAGRPRLLRARQLHLRIRAAGGEPALRRRTNRRIAEDVVEQLPAGEYPHLAELTTEHVLAARLRLRRRVRVRARPDPRRPGAKRRLAVIQPGRLPRKAPRRFATWRSQSRLLGSSGRSMRACGAAWCTNST